MKTPPVTGPFTVSSSSRPEADLGTFVLAVSSLSLSLTDRFLGLTCVGNTLYTLHELSSTLTEQIIPLPPNGTTPLIANLSILPPTIPEGSDFHAAEILLTEFSPSFPQPFIYASNRNTGNVDPRGDTIAIFAVEPKLTLVNQVYTGLDQIRGMMLGGPENEFLIAAGVAGDAGTKMFKRVDGGADLELITTNTDIPQRSSFVWLD